MLHAKKKGYHRLKIVPEAKILIKMVYKYTENFPKSEEFGLKSQLRRASVSILLNIVEGERRTTDKEFLRFLEISDSSSAELEVGLEISLDLSFLTKNQFQIVEDQRQKVTFMLIGLKNKVKSCI